MCKKSSVFFLLLCTIKVIFTHQPNGKNILSEVDIMNKLGSETAKCINKQFKKDNHETTRLLQSIANNFNLHQQDAFHFFYRTVDLVKSPKLRNSFIDFMHETQKAPYGVSKILKNSTQIRSELLNSIESLIKVCPMGKEVIEQALETQDELTIKSVTYSYDLALFSFVSTNIETKYCQESNERIIQEIEEALRNITILLPQAGAGLTTKSNELAALVQVFCHCTLRVIQKIERFLYINKTKSKITQGITSITRNLEIMLYNYNRHNLLSAASAQLPKNMKEPLVSLLAQIKSLKLFVDNTNIQEKDLYMNILLETLSLMVTFNYQLDFLKTNT